MQISFSSKSTPFIKLFSYSTHSFSNIKPSLLINKLEYWFSRDKFKQGFFKFIEPCHHRLYKKNDSWTEEFGWGRDLFKTVFNQIGIRYKSKALYKQALKTGDPFQGKLYLSYYDRQQNLTFYKRNHACADTFFHSLALSFKNHYTQKKIKTGISQTVFTCLKEKERPKKICTSPQSGTAENPQSPYTRLTTYTLSSKDLCHEILSQEDRTDAYDLEREREREKRVKKINVQTKRKLHQKEINQMSKIKEVKETLQTLETQGKEPENQENEKKFLKNNPKQEVQTHYPKTAQRLKQTVKPTIRSDNKHMPAPLPQKRKKEEKKIYQDPQLNSGKDKLNTPPNKDNKTSKGTSNNQILPVNPKNQDILTPQRTPEIPQKSHQDLQLSHSQDDDKICHTMITIWKKYMGATPLWHPSKLFHKLKTALRCFFNDCLQTWDAFCAKIASSKFLMGEKGPFKIFLSWAIQPETIQRILNNGFTFGDREASSEPSEHSHTDAEKKKHIQHRIDHLLQDEPTEEKTQLMEAFLTSDLPLNLVRNIKHYGITRGSFEESCFKSYLWKRFDKEMTDKTTSKESHRLQTNPIGDIF